MPRSLIEAGNTQSATTNTVTVAGNTVVSNMVEKTVVHTRSPSGAVEIDIFRGTIHYFTTSAAGDFQFNFRFSSTPGGVNTVVSAGQSLTVAVLVTNGATAYRVSNVLLDDNELITPVKWNGASGAPSEGTENSIDTYVFTFIKKLNGSLEILGNAKSTGGTFGGGSAGALLYEFTTATFTSGGQTGRTGPALSTARAGLTGAGTEVWKNNTEFFNTSTGIQLWTVPSTGTYRIQAQGAQGGNAGGNQGGRGASMQGDFVLTSGEIIRIVVGQQGATGGHTQDGNPVSAGGGGTYVVRTPYTTDQSILVIGGGGGGGAQNSWNSTAGQNAGTSTAGGQGGSGSGGGTNGSGGASSTGCGGAGFIGNGATGSGSSESEMARAFVNGSRGGGNARSWGGSEIFGGFGGGGGGLAAGGGGGYSGGAAGQWSSQQMGGGGGSFNSGTNRIDSGGVRTGSGQVIVTKL